MKGLAIIVLVIVSQNTFAQLDSLKINFPVGSFSSLAGKLDSAETSVVDDIDSVRQYSKQVKSKIQSLPFHYQQKIDSVGKGNLTGKIDSIETSLHSQIDSVTGYYNQIATKIRNLSSSYQQKIDSLTNLKLPTEKYSRKLDSLNNKLSEAQLKVISKIESIKQKATEKLKSLPIPPELQGKLTRITSSIESFKLPTLNSGINNPIDFNRINASGDKLVPSVDLEGFPNLPLPNGMADVVGNLDVDLELPKVNGMPDIVKDLDDVSDLTGGVTDQVETLQQNVEGVSRGNQIDKLVENQAMKLDEISELAKAKNSLPLSSLSSEKEAKKQLLNKAKETAVDHFKGKEEALKSAMSKISKYKQKYSSISGISEITKRPPNPMKGKTLRERIVPGFQFQFFQKQENFLTDLNLYVGYRLNGRLTTGLGWNQRIAYDLDIDKFNPNARVFGPRAFGEFKLRRGFSPRAEVEVMNTLIPTFVSTTSADVGNREWVVSGLIGIKKEYRFYKNIKGTTMIMFNMFHSDSKSPYANRVNVRVGFELMPKRKRK